MENVKYETKKVIIDGLQNFKTGGFLGIGGTEHKQKLYAKDDVCGKE